MDRKNIQYCYYKGLSMDRKNIYNIIEKKAAATKEEKLHKPSNEILASIRTLPPSIFLPKGKKKNEDNRPSAKVIHEVVSSVGGLTRNEVFKATQRLMNGNV
ncbi:hypothetical protein Leryth_004400 [Lithospermum erythrorhizon]|nr:hypothetical protein Leryth_004400 [Lithospermum erythrorhizon]